MGSASSGRDQPMLLTGAILMLIGGMAAFLLAGVNLFTQPRIAENKAAKETLAVKAVFPDAEDVERRGDLIEVRKNGVPVGWMVRSVAKGYGGDLVLMVGISADRRIAGIQVLEMKETPGLGTKIAEAAKGEAHPRFLAQFFGKDGRTVEFGRDVQAISGATISSKAVLEGVRKAYAALDAGVPGGAQAVSEASGRRTKATP